MRAGSNIAFIKYWGVDDATLNIPQNNSISMTLADAHTITSVEWAPRAELAQDQITIDDQLLDSAASTRLVRHLDRIRNLAQVDERARVVSQNNFPMASGIASSASGFAALSVAGCAALGLELDNTQLSALARLGSGSASRSLFDGYVEWEQGHDHDSSIAFQLYPAEHWALYDLVAVVSRAPKKVSSAHGHPIAATSPLNRGRIDSLGPQLEAVREAISACDLSILGPVIEQDALAMHAVMMTGSPSLLYWQGATIDIMHAVRQWRAEEGLQVYFTIDAGPNVHLLCEADDVDSVRARLQTLNVVERVIVSRPGPAPTQLTEHLF